MDELVLLGQIYGEGSAMAKKLRAKGFDSLEKIARAEPGALVKALKGNMKMAGAGEMVQMATALIDARRKKTNDLIVLEGVGKTTSEKLWEAGFRTIESIVSADPEDISEKCRIPESICKKVVASARKIVDKPDREVSAMLEETVGEEPGLSPGEAKEIAEIAEMAAEAVSPEVEEPSKEAPAPEPDITVEEEDPRVVAFRSRLARLIAKELFD